MYGIDFYRLGVRNNSFHQPQLDPNSSWVDFFEKVFIYVKKILFLKWYKGRKQFFPSHSIWSESISNNFQRRFLPELKVCESYLLGVRNNSFHQPQFDPNSSWVDFFEKVFKYVKERLFLKWYKGRKQFFPSHSIWSESVSNNFSEKVFAKIKSLSIIRIINKPVGAKFKTGK